ncbi:MMPL family transporter [Picrophilus oshimae]|uniref:Putative drug exporter of the RND superfamily n=1 Tax=Picrophilus torridus (strain ATCC 700027 / DSM 9790 / JCM 10055 / NBRC 100828 / KAW 2/3) TaxID=1122961 RepID=A0A8G2FWK8_PICTO|nr:MMPL family transporter [Picrophilus oshimae]SMD30814.1 putative drug exporter of the RND superfamily [Picrophilus oshimae DSM 9789]
MVISKSIIKRRVLLIIIWAIVLVAIIPAVTGYTHYISYSNSSPVGPGSESSIAQHIIEKKFPDNSSLIVVVNGSSPSKNMASTVLGFQSNLSGLGLKNYYSSSSVYSEYAAYINNEINASISSRIIYDYTMIKNNAIEIFSEPAEFYILWSHDGFNNSSINKNVMDSFSPGTYREKFYSAIINSTGSPYNRVESSIGRSIVMDLFNATAFKYLNITDYNNKSSIINATSYMLNYSGLSYYIINSVVSSSNPGIFYVTHYGIYNAPSFISSAYVAGNISLIYIDFDTPAGMDVMGSYTASELAFPAVNNLAMKTFKNAIVTGNGAISYETNKETQKAGFAFGLIFIFLAVAILFAALSWKSSILVIIFSGIALLLGYTSEYITGLILHSVSYIVNYTLTAVILGISADYLLFIISRYRDELRSGSDEKTALETSIRSSGRSILISGITVAFSLATFSFIPGFKSWGITLFLAVIFTIALETTLLPVIISFLGRSLFLRYALKPDINDKEKSKFYKAAEGAISKKFFVIIIIIILGSSGIYAFFNAPVTYNFNTGLPQNLESVRGLNLIDKSFGSSTLYPVYVIVNESIGSEKIENISYYIASLSWVDRAYGPYINGKYVNSSIGYSSYKIDSHYVYYILYSRYSPYSKNAINAVSQLRSNHDLIVGGITSTIIDEAHQNKIIYSELEILIVLVIGIIIGVSFRSWKYPVISLSGVFFSVSWTTGILYLISKYVLHEALIYLIPVILFIILFSLGNDYTVFIISRIREYSSLNRDNAIKIGISTSGRVVTTLGIILAVSLGALSFIPVAFLEQLGISFIISLIIDTFIIRIFYFPAMISALFKNKI